MPANTAWITDPKRFIYNKIYRRTTVSVDQLLRSPRIGRQRHRAARPPSAAANDFARLLALVVIVALALSYARQLLLVVAGLALTFVITLAVAIGVAYKVPASRAPILKARGVFMGWIGRRRT